MPEGGLDVDLVSYPRHRSEVRAATVCLSTPAPSKSDEEAATSPSVTRLSHYTYIYGLLLSFLACLCASMLSASLHLSSITLTSTHAHIDDGGISSFIYLT